MTLIQIIFEPFRVKSFRKKRHILVSLTSACYKRRLDILRSSTTLARTKAIFACKANIALDRYDYNFLLLINDSDDR